MASPQVRLAVRAIILHADRLLLVNAWANGKSQLLCAPGGGVETGASLPDNLVREVHEETGLQIRVGAPCLINEFHDPATGFHQVDIFFRCVLTGEAAIAPDWQDPERIVDRHVWATRAELAHLMVKPDSLARIAFDPADRVTYDSLEQIVM